MLLMTEIVEGPSGPNRRLFDISPVGDHEDYG
jgi:hypothetical protein